MFNVIYCRVITVVHTNIQSSLNITNNKKFYTCIYRYIYIVQPTTPHHYHYTLNIINFSPSVVRCMCVFIFLDIWDCCIWLCVLQHLWRQSFYSFSTGCFFLEGKKTPWGLPKSFFFWLLKKGWCGFKIRHQVGPKRR